MRALTPSAGADLVPAEAHQSTHGAERVFLFLFCFFFALGKVGFMAAVYWKTGGAVDNTGGITARGSAVPVVMTFL